MGSRNWVDASAIGEHALGKVRGEVSALVARASLWANPEAFYVLPALNPWSRLARGDERPGSTVLDWGPRVFHPAWDDPTNLAPVAVKLLDERTLARQFLRLVAPRLSPARFSVRTVWPDTASDARYASCIGNLVALPASISPLLEVSLAARLALRGRAERLFGWRPDGLAPTEGAEGAGLEWRAPEPFPALARRALLRRRKYLARLPEKLLGELSPNEREKAVRAEFDFGRSRRS
ncbi:MAG TPA: hypothetical protein VFI25_15955 [Planctomycetota bacterium]|jgi:hypothetical protein|nr:hypothetical protein [Planctomycetota bacterium]